MDFHPANELVIAVYTPFPGKEKELSSLLSKHTAALRAEGLITERPPVVARSKDGSFLEIFEWKSGAEASRAHNSKRVTEIWHKLAEVARFSHLSELSEANQSFPHFSPMTPFAPAR